MSTTTGSTSTTQSLLSLQEHPKADGLSPSPTQFASPTTLTRTSTPQGCNYLTVNGVKTVNAKYVSGISFQVAESPITVKKGGNYVFEKKKDPDPDTCCLEYYSNSNCAEAAGQFQKRCEMVQGIEYD